MNKTFLTGRLTADPEMRYTQSQMAVCQFTLAVDRFMGKDKENEADFIRCTAWGKTAEHVEKYYFKGKKAIVEGNIRTGSYQDKNGETRYTTDVWVEKIEFADDKKKDNVGQASPQQNIKPADAPPWGGNNSNSSSVPPWMV